MQLTWVLVHSVPQPCTHNLMPHSVQYWPKTVDGNGTGICSCGASIRIEHRQFETAQLVGQWHSCPLCGFPPWSHDTKGNTLPSEMRGHDDYHKQEQHHGTQSK